MDREKVKAFFNQRADTWDENMVRNEEVISTILDNAHIEEGNDVLDVACGTGVLIPDYLDRNVNSVTGIDLSDKMTEIAQRKFADEKKVTVITGDVIEYRFDRLFDRIVVYNALPHFEDAEQLIRVLKDLLKDGGYLTIAHGFSRSFINRHHGNISSCVKKELMTIEELADIMKRYLEVTVAVSDDRMYQIVGQKRG